MNLTNFFSQITKHKQLSEENQKLKQKLQKTVNNISGALAVQNANLENQIKSMNLPFGIANAVTNSQALGTLTTTSSFQNLMNAFNSIKGMPYKFGAEGNGAIDCSAFTQKMMKAGGVNVPRTANEQYLATKNNLVCTDFDPSKMQPGDMIFFKNTTSKTPSGLASHAGIYIGNGKMIHSGASTKGVGVVDLTKGYNKGKWLAVTRPSNNFVQKTNTMLPQTNNQMSSGVKNLFSKVSKNLSLQQKYLANKNAFLLAQQKTGVEAGLLAAIAGVESNYNPNATGGPGTTVTGIYQIRPKDWNDGYKWGKKYGVLPAMGAKDNAQAALWIASRFANNRDSGYYKRIGIPNPNGLDFYMTHFLGEGGYATLSRNLDVPAANILPKEAKYNKSIFYDKGRPRTGREIKNLMLSKLRNKYAECGIDLPCSVINNNVRV